MGTKKYHKETEMRQKLKKKYHKEPQQLKLDTW